MAFRMVKDVAELTEKICGIWKKECKKHEKRRSNGSKRAHEESISKGERGREGL